MKKNILKLILLVVVFTSCNSGKDETDQQMKKTDSLQGIVDEKNTVINSFLALFNDVQNSLDSISLREKSIRVRTEKPEEVKSVIIDQINKDISIINTIIKNNKKNIIAINNKLKSAIQRNKQLEEAMIILNQKLTNKEADLSYLRNKLDDYDTKIITLETSVGILETEKASLEETVAEETKLLHTVHYVFANLKELQKDSIIDRKGGLLGIGKTSTLKSDFNEHKFTKIDYLETTAIPINWKKIKIVTTHSKDSYSLDESNGTIHNILIKDPEKFWSASKYLVIIKG